MKVHTSEVFELPSPCIAKNNPSHNHTTTNTVRIGPIFDGPYIHGQSSDWNNSCTVGTGLV